MANFEPKKQRPRQYVRGALLGACAGALGAMLYGWQSPTLIAAFALIGAGLWTLSIAVQLHLFRRKYYSGEPVGSRNVDKQSEESAVISGREIPVSRREHRFFDKLPRAYWRGAFSLAASFWVGGLLATMPSYLIRTIMVYVDVSEHPKYVALLVVSIWIFGPLVAIWWTVGTWRSARRYRGRKIWVISARVLTILTLVTLCIDGAARGSRQVSEAARMLVSLGKYEIRIKNNGSLLELAGTLEFGVSADVVTALESHPGVSEILLTSGGGRLKEANMLADVVANRNLDTAVSGECSSACVNVFAAGEKRLISKSAIIGLHGATAFGTLDDDAFLNQQTRDLLLRRGVDRRFIDRALSVPSDQLWYPSHRELFEAGLATDYWEDEDIEASE